MTQSISFFFHTTTMTMIVAWMPPYSRSVVHAMEQGGLPTSLHRLQQYAKVLQEHRSLRPAAVQGHPAQDRMEADRQRALGEGLHGISFSMSYPGTDDDGFSFSYPPGGDFSMSFPSWDDEGSFSYPPTTGFSYPLSFDYDEISSNDVVDNGHQGSTSDGTASNGSHVGGSDNNHNQGTTSPNDNDSEDGTSTSEPSGPNNAEPNPTETDGSAIVQNAATSDTHKMTTGSIVAVVLGAMVLVLASVAMAVRHLRKLSLSSSSGMSAIWSSSSSSESSSLEGFTATTSV